MDPVILIMIAACGGVIALVFGIGSFIQSQRASQAEARLAAFTGTSGPSSSQIADDILCVTALVLHAGILGKVLARFQNLPMFFQQAESPVKIEQFALICAAAAAAGGLLSVLARCPPALMPCMCCGRICAGPWLWLWLRRRSRFKQV